MFDAILPYVLEDASVTISVMLALLVAYLIGYPPKGLLNALKRRRDKQADVTKDGLN